MCIPYTNLSSCYIQAIEKKMVVLRGDLAVIVMALSFPGKQIFTMLCCRQHQISFFPLALVLIFRIHVAKKEARGREAGDCGSVAGTSFFVHVGPQRQDHSVIQTFLDC